MFTQTVRIIAAYAVAGSIATAAELANSIFVIRASTDYDFSFASRGPLAFHMSVSVIAGVMGALVFMLLARAASARHAWFYSIAYFVVALSVALAVFLPASDLGLRERLVLLGIFIGPVLAYCVSLLLTLQLTRRIKHA